MRNQLINKICQQLFCFIVTTTLLFGASSCSNETGSSNEALPGTQDVQNQPKSFTLAIAPTPLSALPIIAHHQGLFTEQSLDIKMINFSAGKLALDAVVGGNAEFATVAETPVMYAGLAKVDLKIIASIVSSNTDLKFVARKDRIANHQDLPGKTYSAFIGTAGEYFMDQYFAKNGIERSAVTVVSLRPNEMVTSLIHGDIDAFFSWEPNNHKALQYLKNNAWIETAPSLYTLTFNIASKPQFLSTHPQEAKQFLQALIKAEQFIRQYPKKSMNIISEYTGMELSLLEAIWNHYHFEVSLQPHVADMIHQQAVWALKQRSSDVSRSKIKPAELRHSLIDSDLLQSIDSSRVAVETSEH